jgi:hypothetical protein
LTKALTSLCGFMLGDVLAQNLEGSSSLDFARVLHLGAYGFFLDGPIGHLWYKCALAQISNLKSSSEASSQGTNAFVGGQCVLRVCIHMLLCRCHLAQHGSDAWPMVQAGAAGASLCHNAHFASLRSIKCGRADKGSTLSECRHAGGLTGHATRHLRTRKAPPPSQPRRRRTSSSGRPS